MNEAHAHLRLTEFGARLLMGLPIAIIALGGCSGGLSGEDPTRIGAFTPGPAVDNSNFFGVPFEPCTAIELEGYPAYLPRASYDYYQGPWCASEGDARTYLWVYARPLTSEQSAMTVNEDVLADAEQKVLDLEAQGYRRVCGAVTPGTGVDAGFESPSEATRLRLANRGQVSDPPQATSTEPPSLVVSVSPATRAPSVPQGAYAPPC